MISTVLLGSHPVLKLSRVEFPRMSDRFAQPTMMSPARFSYRRSCTSIAVFSLEMLPVSWGGFWVLASRSPCCWGCG